MSINQPIPLQEGLAILREARLNATSISPEGYPASLNRSEIARMISVFQPRQLEGRLVEDEDHIRTLTNVIGSADRPKYLDPITVWWSGDRWYVIDGHHRLLAYHRAGVTENIPVTVFEGTLDEAMAQSVAANSKDRLTMTNSDKLNYAWRLVVVSDLTKAQIVEACSVANGTVGNMRGAKRKLMDEKNYTVADLADLDWKSARDEAEDRERTEEYDPSEAIKKRAEQYRRALAKSLGNRAFKDPEAFALALYQLDRRFPERLMQCDAWATPMKDAVMNMAADYREAEELAKMWESSDEY